MAAGRPHVVVVGAGITGLAAAHALRTPAAVTVLEAAPEAGGKLQGGPFAGLPHVDAGADMFLVRTPAAIELARAVGLGDELVAPNRVPPYVLVPRAPPPSAPGLGARCARRARSPRPLGPPLLARQGESGHGAPDPSARHG